MAWEEGSVKPIRNLEVALYLNCAACDTRAYARAKTPQAGLDIALAGGWFIVSGKHKIALCPVHNPSRTEFVGYLRAKAA